MHHFRRTAGGLEVPIGFSLRWRVVFRIDAHAAVVNSIFGWCKRTAFTLALFIASHDQKGLTGQSLACGKQCINWNSPDFLERSVFCRSNMVISWQSVGHVCRNSPCSICQHPALAYAFIATRPASGRRVPCSIIVPDEKKRNRVFRSQCFRVYVTCAMARLRRLARIGIVKGGAGMP